MHTGYWLKIQKEKDNLEDEDVDGYIALRQILEKQNEMH
jgi:hypothetical protein